jgi:Planctomycete cytochrome C
MKTTILRSSLRLSLLASSALLLAACGEKEISYKADVQPILQQYCVECHADGGKGAEKSGLVLTSYESVMKGTRFGSIIKPGDALSSTLIMLVEGRADPSIKMPHGKESLPKEKIEVLKQWVAQGAKNN